MTIRVLRLVGFTTLALALPVAALQANPEAEITSLTPEQLTWVADAGGSGAKTAVLAGSEKGTENFVRRRQYPAAYVEPPHTHPATIFVTVLSGTLRFGTGEKYDEKKLTSFHPGSFLTIPAGVAHFASMPDGAVVQISGNAPHGSTPVAAAAKAKE